MRIIAGRARGRRLVGPKGTATRPPTDRMREALFSSLGRRVAGAAVLDLYAGSGTFGLEALSRGAQRATFVERNRAALAALRSNIDAVGLGGSVVAAEVTAALAATDDVFDLVFVDPPYAESAAAVGSVVAAAGELLADDGLIVLHRRFGREEVDTRGSLVSTRRRRYGDAEVWWYEKEAR